MNIISVNLIGPGELSPNNHNYGLCNQMFQVSAALSYAKDNKFQAIFPCLRDTKKYGNYTDNIFRKLIIDKDMPPNYLWYSQRGFSYTPIPKSNSSILIYNCYLQSEKYFSHNRKLILETFSASKEDENYLKEKYGNILNCNKTISCHIRRGDYISLKEIHTPLCESNYYNDALDNFEDGILFVFSDDIKWCKENFKTDNREMVFVEEKDYLELYLMSMCNDNIIANSTFSWWGAWLNKNKNKKVIAPKEWFGVKQTESDEDLIPEKWIRV